MALSTNTLRQRSVDSHLDSLERQRGAMPLNPFRRARLILNLTQQQLADKTGTSKLSVMRLEQGAYDKPLPVVVDFLVTYHAYSELHLRDDYIGFQIEIRGRYSKLFGDSLLFDSFDNTHPLRQLRSGVDGVGIGVTELSKRLCVAQATLSYFEKKYHRQKSVPRNFLEALLQCGYTQNQIDGFERNYLEWRKFQMGMREGVSFD